MRSQMLRDVTLKTGRLIVFTVAIIALPTYAVAGSSIEELAVRAGFKILAKGDSSAEAHKQANAGIPLNRMSPKNRQRAAAVIDKCNQFRRLPELQYTADPAIYRYLLEQPDVAVSTWRVMGISKFEMWQTGPMEYEATAVDGSEGLTHVLYRDDQQCIFICDGSYHNPLLLKPLEAAALVWFRYGFSPGEDGATLVSQKADVFIAFPSQGLSTIAKILTPVTNSMMDRNMYEVSLYAGLMSRAVRDEPEWVIQVAQQMDGVLPQRPAELIAVARQPRIDLKRSPPKSAGKNNDSSRAMLMSSGISLFGPPKPEDLAAAPGISAPPVPPVPEKSGTMTAAGSSANPKNEKSAPPAIVPAVTVPAVSVSASSPTKSADTPATTGPVRAAAIDNGAFELQQSVVPPAARPTLRN